MSLEENSNVNMTHLVATPVADNPTPLYTSTTTTGEERTLTGIPITLLWLPYVGFSAFLIALMGLSFLQYHRKHGHKYHNANDDLVDGGGGNLDDYFDNAANQGSGGGGGLHGSQHHQQHHHHRGDGQSRSHSVDKVALHNTAHPPPSSRDGGARYEHIQKVTETTYRSEKRRTSRPHSGEKDPPNGGMNLSSQSRRARPYRTMDENEPAYEQLLKRNDSQLSAASSSRQASGYHPSQKPSSSSSHTRPRGPANKPNCDEPSTSSSTVSSKTSSNASKSTSSTRNRPPPPRNRQRRSVNYESNQNGSMVDVRIDVDESVATFKPAKTKPQLQQQTSKEQRVPSAGQRQVNNPTATEQRMGLFCAPPETISPSGGEKHHSPGVAMPTIKDRIYRGNYVASRSTSPQGGGSQTSSSNRHHSGHSHHTHAHSRGGNGNGRGVVHDDEGGGNGRHVTSDRTSASGAVPIWSTTTTMPLRSKHPSSAAAAPLVPHKEHYAYPFTPSGNMQMLSDTEDDEVFLLKHTKL